MERYVTVRNYRISHTDIVRFWIIVSLALCCILITALSLEQNAGNLSTQLFYFPILYATYFYPRRGVLVAAACAVVYEVLVYVHYFPDAFHSGQQPVRQSCLSVSPPLSGILPRRSRSPKPGTAASLSILSLESSFLTRTVLASPSPTSRWSRCSVIPQTT